ncbi:MAG TPA: DNA-binding protein [Cyanobacteria bacterium UBA8530]|nr:DNA-binding protein [Cyanobacteria bacterium UBA8530]
MSRHIILWGLFLFFLAAPAEALIIETVIRVQVAGEVRRPGVYCLPVQSRVADAIQLAGGLKKGASLANLNLSSALRDGEAVAVLNEEKIKKAQKIEKIEKTEKPGKKKKRRSPAPSTKECFSLNSATLAELDALPGIGPGLARDILAYREIHGGFRSLEELKEVDGIGEKRFNKLAARIKI